MAKNKINSLRGKRLVTGDPNLVTRNEIHVSSTSEGVEITERDKNGKLVSISMPTEGGGQSQYHEIKPNGWYWKAKEEVDWRSRLMGLEVHLVLCAIGESFKDTEYAPLNFAETYSLIGQLSQLSEEDDSFNTFYQRFPNYIQEAVPIKGAMGLPNFNSVQEFYQFQGQDESAFLAFMEQIGWERITEEEYNEAKSKLGQS